MSRREVAQLDDKCVEVRHDSELAHDGFIVTPQILTELFDEGYPIEGIRTPYPSVSVKQDEDDSGYLVFEVETLEYPAEVADAAVDATTFWACTCPGWRFHHNKDFPKDVRPSGVSDCPHTRKVKRKERVHVEDEDQTRFDTPVGDK